MCKLFDRWKTEIQTYCRDNGLDFDKVSKMCQAWGRDDLIFQYHDPQKGINGLRDETPASVVLIMKIQEGKPVFEQTKYTKQYLS